MGSIYFLIRAQEVLGKKRIKILFYAFYLGAFAATANLVLLNYYMSLLFVVVLLLGINYRELGLNKREGLLKEMKGLFVFNVLFLAIIIAIIVPLQQREQFYFGGKDNFVNDTIKSLIRSSLYFREYHNKSDDLILVGVIITIVLSVVLFLYQSLRQTRLTIPAVILMILLVSVIIVVLQHSILDVPFPMERTALFYIPLFLLVLVYCSREIVEVAGLVGRVTITPLLLLFYVALSAHFIMTANFTRTFAWPYDASTKAMMMELSREHSALDNNDRQMSIGINWLFEPTINYYRISRDLKWLQPATRAGVLSEHYDYYYVFEDEREKIDRVGASILKHYPASQTILAKSNR